MRQRFTTVVLILVFLGAMFGGLFHLTMGMEMTGDTPGCLFMSDGEAVCSMSALDHVGSWESVFLAITPIFVLLSLMFTIVAVALAPNLLFRYQHTINVIVRRIFTQVPIIPRHHLQELFSSGILHPKLF